jgi:hypothetical protein
MVMIAATARVISDATSNAPVSALDVQRLKRITRIPALG